MYVRYKTSSVTKSGRCKNHKEMLEKIIESDEGDMESISFKGKRQKNAFFSSLSSTSPCEISVLLLSLFEKHKNIQKFRIKNLTFEPGHLEIFYQIFRIKVKYLSFENCVFQDGLKDIMPKLLEEQIYLDTLDLGYVEMGDEEMVIICNSLRNHKFLRQVSFLGRRSDICPYLELCDYNINLNSIICSPIDKKQLSQVCDTFIRRPGLCNLFISDLFYRIIGIEQIFKKQQFDILSIENLFHYKISRDLSENLSQNKTIQYFFLKSVKIDEFFMKHFEIFIRYNTNLKGVIFDMCKIYKLKGGIDRFLKILLLSKSISSVKIRDYVDFQNEDAILEYLKKTNANYIFLDLYSINTSEDIIYYLTGGDLESLMENFDNCIRENGSLKYVKINNSVLNCKYNLDVSKSVNSSVKTFLCILKRHVMMPKDLRELLGRALKSTEIDTLSWKR